MFVLIHPIWNDIQKVEAIIMVAVPSILFDQVATVLVNSHTPWYNAPNRDRSAPIREVIVSSTGSPKKTPAGSPYRSAQNFTIRMSLLRENMCTKFHWSLIKRNKVTEVWNFFYKSAFRLVGLDGKIMDLPHWNFSGWYRGVKLTCIPNLSQIGQFL